MSVVETTRKDGINVLSLFDGISIGRVALDRANVKVNAYYSSEIKDDAIKVADSNFPNDANLRLGDVTKITKSDLPEIDLLIGGSPCQDFSVANKVRDGLDGDKSGLFYEYLRLLKELKPKYFFLENVKMKKEEEEEITRLLGVEPIKINSEKVSPQLRNRLYWTNIPQSDEDIEEVSVTLNDILEDGYSDRKKARTLLVSDSRPLTTPIKMAHRYFNTGFTTLIFKSEEHYNAIKEHFDKNFKGKSAKEIDELIKGMDLSLYDGVRYMTPSEREACQNLPKGYTKDVDWYASANLLGDSWTTDVIAHLFSGLNK